MFKERYSTGPLNLLDSVWRHRAIIWQMTKRDVIGRYRGSFLGLLWSFVNPLVMLAVYTFVFSVVFKTKWGVETGNKAHFAIVLFAGLIVYNLFSETVNRAPSLVLGNVNYVKRIVFPLHVLPVIAVGTALFHAFVSLIVLLAFSLVINAYVPYTSLFLPLILFPFILLITGVAWFLASLAVYIRDVSQSIAIFTTALLFLSPIFYPVSVLPEHLRIYLFLNPLTFIIEETRAVLLFGIYPNWLGLALYSCCGFAVAALGYWWFQKTRTGFADVL